MAGGAGQGRPKREKPERSRGGAMTDEQEAASDRAAAAAELAALEHEADLASFCPHCHAPLSVFDANTKRVWIGLTVDVAGESGELLLNPRFDAGERISDKGWVDGSTANDVRCPHCHDSLLEPDRRCDLCDAPVFAIEVSVRTRVAPLSLCTRAGCNWRGVSTKAAARVKSVAPRQKKPGQDAMLRVRNFSEVSYGYDSDQAVAEAQRCLQCEKPVCVDGCPVQVDIPGFVELISLGRFAAAAEKIRGKNALPAICGRVCPQDEQCEAKCLLGKKGEPLAIGALERFAADFERETDQVKLPLRAPRTGKCVAVVGSGPAGLTLAADLGVQGHSVTIFESLHKPGGVLVYGIPEFRLPKSIVEAETGNLRHLGVKFELNSIVGKLYGLLELFDMGFDAVYIATGAGLPGFMGLPGENLCNVVSANEYLTRVNLMKAYLFPEYDTPAPIGTRVAVVGGGNVAMDCARTALRMGAGETTIVYRRTRDEMPARSEEIEHAEQEGVRFRYLASPVSYVGDERHWVRQMKCVRMKMGEPDQSGRRRPIPMLSSTFLLDVDMVVVAVGAGPNRVLFEGAPGLERTERGYIQTFSESGRTSVPRVWAGGDIVTGAATVILAMGAARLAADDIHTYLSEGRSDWV
jgi:glutamate synthase (NADPH/NADH) small chain